MTHKAALQRIAAILRGIDRADMTVAERQINDVLQQVKTLDKSTSRH